jgi:transposase
VFFRDRQARLSSWREGLVFKRRRIDLSKPKATSKTSIAKMGATIDLTNNKQEVMEVLTGPERRRRWSAQEKPAMVRESFEPGKSVSMVARQHGVNPNQLFHWRKLYQDGSLSAVSAGEEVVPASELSDALKQIRELQRLLGKKTMENEILREAVEVAKSRKWIARSPSLPGDDQ